jgi:protein required for attachment to host cells
MGLRHFLERTQAEPKMNAEENQLLLVIDHNEARLFRSGLHGAIPQQMLPHEREDCSRRAHHSRNSSRGREKALGFDTNDQSPLA